MMEQFKIGDLVTLKSQDGPTIVVTYVSDKNLQGLYWHKQNEKFELTPNGAPKEAFILMEKK